MSLLKDLIASVPSSRLSLDEVILGPRWTLVAASRCGLAAVPSGGQAENRTRSKAISGMPVKDLLPLASSADPSEASLGVASLNALLQESLKAASFRPNSIPRAGGKSVGLVGEFAFAEKLRAIAAEVVMIERDAAESLLPRVDITIVSGACIVDHSLEALLRASSRCYTIVFGPSTPLSPVLFDYGADQLVGVRVENREQAASWITAGKEDLMACPGLRSIVLRKN